MEDVLRELVHKYTGNNYRDLKDIAKFLSQLRELVPSEEDIVKIMIDFWVRKDLFKTKETTEDLAKSIHKAIIEKMFGKEK